jgi:hypothetical protein
MGFRKTDLVVGVGAMVLIGLILYTSNDKRNYGTEQVNCIGNLKQIDLAFKLWTEDDGEKLPIQISQLQGGTLESALSGSVAPTFVRMSNQLFSPKILICPSDQVRHPRPALWESVTDDKISYFLAMDASYGNPRHVLTGDRNIAVNNSRKEAKGLIIVGNELRWTKSLHREKGNVALGDGSIQTVETPRLREIIKETGLVTNRFVVP